MQASSRALSHFATPDILEFDGWTVPDGFLDALPEDRPKRAVVLGPNMVWPDEGCEEGMLLCQQLGRRLPTQPANKDVWVVHDSCGVSNLTQMVLGRNKKTPGRVYVITDDKQFVPDVEWEVSMRVKKRESVRTELFACRGMPTVPPRDMAWQQRVAERVPELMKYERVQRECSVIAAALTGEAEAAEDAGRAADATRLREKAAQAADMETKAALMVQSLEQEETDPVLTETAGAALQCSTESVACFWVESVQSA